MNNKSMEATLAKKTNHFKIVPLQGPTKQENPTQGPNTSFTITMHFSFSPYHCAVPAKLPLHGPANKGSLFSMVAIARPPTRRLRHENQKNKMQKLSHGCYNRWPGRNFSETHYKHIAWDSRTRTRALTHAHAHTHTRTRLHRHERSRKHAHARTRTDPHRRLQMHTRAQSCTRTQAHALATAGKNKLRKTEVEITSPH